MELLSDPNAWASLLTLALMEIVLGIDNLVFISIVVEKLPVAKQDFARKLGLALALLMRIALLLAISWIIGLTRPLFTLFELEISWRDIILLAGGTFLLVKGTLEIHDAVEGDRHEGGKTQASTLAGAVTQIVLLDLVFSIDSVVTAVGMAEHVEIMIVAVTIAIGVMLFAAEPVGDFIRRHPTTKMLALSFLLLIGVSLVADGLHFHMPRGYIYAAIAFSVLVEALNLAARGSKKAG